MITVYENKTKEGSHDLNVEYVGLFLSPKHVSTALGVVASHISSYLKHKRHDLISFSHKKYVVIDGKHDETKSLDTNINTGRNHEIALARLRRARLGHLDDQVLSSLTEDQVIKINEILKQS